MANFLITSPNSLAQGTDTADLFVLNTALGATVYGNGGADQISAAAAGNNLTNAKIYGGPGGDTVFLTGDVAPNGSVAGFYLGAGNDVFAASGLTLIASTLIGGGGNDSITLQSGTLTDTNVNGNAGSDLISLTGSALLTRAFIAGGGDADNINLTLAAADASTVNGGGGADTIVLSGGNFSGGRIDADTLNDSQYYGNDTVTINGTLTASFVQLGGGGDRIIVSGSTLSGTIEGGAGLDSISLAGLTGNSFVGGGAGVDTISVSGLAAGFGTIQGGGGADIINVSGGSAGALMGGAGADAIGLGSIAQSWGTGTAPNANASGINVAYQSFDQSNLDNLDVISGTDAGAAGSGGAFTVTQSAVNFTATTNGTYGIAGNQFTVNSGARVTNFDNAGTTTLAARAALLDSALNVGQSVVFQNAAGTSYLFVQGGTAGSGVANDLIAQLNVGGFLASGADAALVTGGLFVTNNSALKINFTDNARF